MRQVFISYSTKDTYQAQTVRNVLEQNGITCWMAPADIPGGSNYTKEIPIAIRGCQAFVLILSNNAQKSHWVLKELDSAVNAGKIILPFQLEDVPLSDEFNFLLTGAQRYDAYKKKTEALKRLVTRIHAIVNSGAATAQDEDPVIPEPVHIPQRNNPGMSGEVVCPGCGGMEVDLLPFTVKPQNLLEFLVRYGLPVLLAFVLPWIVMITAFLFLSIFDLTNEEFAVPMVLLLSLASIIAGAVGGSRGAKEWLRRQHLRRHTVTQGYQCRNCSKKFEVKTDD